MPYTDQYIRDLRHLLKVFIIINCIAAVVVAIGVALVVHVQHEITHQNVLIQQQRSETILGLCEDQNSRRARTIATLNREILTLPPKRRARAEQSQTYTIALINALAPHQNCLDVLRASVRPIR